MVANRIRTKPCIVCGLQTQIEFTDKEWLGYQQWKSGTHIQHAFPRWTPEQRELLITGTHPACWDEMTAGLEEEEED